MIEFNDTIDGFEVEEILRESFNMGDSTPDEITISYNDFVNYSKFLIATTMQSMVDKMKGKETDDQGTNKKID